MSFRDFFFGRHVPGWNRSTGAETIGRSYPIAVDHWKNFFPLEATTDGNEIIAVGIHRDGYRMGLQKNYNKEPIQSICFLSIVNDVETYRSFMPEFKECFARRVIDGVQILHFIDEAPSKDWSIGTARNRALTNAPESTHVIHLDIDNRINDEGIAELIDAYNSSEFEFVVLEENFEKSPGDYRRYPLSTKDLAIDTMYRNEYVGTHYEDTDRVLTITQMGHVFDRVSPPSFHTLNHEISSRSMYNPWRGHNKSLLESRFKEFWHGPVR